MNVWKPITEVAAGYAFNLSAAVAAVEEANPGVLVPVDQGPVVLASDYSGQHRNASHEAYSFLVTCDHYFQPWLASLREFRHNWLPDGRRLSFKKLNEPVRWRALPAFFTTIGALTANVITVMVDHRVGSFYGGDQEALMRTFPDCFPNGTKAGTVEKMFRHASFVALITAALRRENQEMFWVGDHDETLDSDDRREGFARLASHLTFGLTRWRQPASCWFGTTETAGAPDWAEDLAAVADLLAGAYCKMSGDLPAFFGRRSWLVSMSPQNIDRRAQAVGDWLASGPQALRHILLRLEVDQCGEVRASAQAYLGRA